MHTSIDPTTGQEVHRQPLDDPGGLEAKLAAADRAQRVWRTRSFAERAKVLRKVATVLRRDVDEWASWMTREMGKPVREGVGEVNKSAWCAEHYAEHAQGYLAARSLESDATRSYVQHLPLGVVLGILPWNAPFWLAFRVAAPALMAGNAVVVKHDPHVPGCSLALAECFARAGAPDGLYQALFLDVPSVEGVIADPRIRGVSFTGSTRGGSAVAALAGKHIKPMVLELGGSDPAIVLADADLEQAVEKIAIMRFINAGQSCIAAKRVLVEASVHDAFVDAFRHRIAGYAMGDPSLRTTDIGPIARSELRDELHRQVRATVEEGATCVLGGEIPDGPGFFYPPTLLTGVTNAMTACREETFGPVASVLKVSDVDEAVAVANDTPFGLAGSVWTTTERGEAIAAKLDTGQVAVNGVVKTDPRLPSGGTKRSGLGKELGPHGIQAFVNTQQVWVG